jgi:hypothetical protein
MSTITFQIAPAGSHQHRADWETLHAAGKRLPFDHSPAAALVRAGAADLWCRSEDASGALLRGAVVHVDRSRKLPFMQLGRLTHACVLLEDLRDDALTSLLQRVREAAHNMVQLSVHLYSTAPDRRRALEQQLQRIGFRVESPARGYHRTLLLPLQHDEPQLLAAMTYAARRGIRQVAKLGYTVRQLDAADPVARLSQLHQAAHHRTGGRARVIDFEALAHAAAADPDSSVLFGVFHPTREAGSALVGFVHGVVADDTVVYASAGTERAADIGSAPLSYGLVWELMRWAQQRGVRYFDFGGITPVDQPHHPLAGISEFKRKFSGKELQVASDMVLPVAPLQSRLLAATGRLLARAKGANS